jgi:hypothetical protein
MAVVRPPFIRVRRSTHKRLTEEAKLAGTSVIEVLDRAADVLEEQRLLDSLERCYEEHGEAIMAEMKDWLDLPGPPLPDDDWSDVLDDGD